MIDNNWFDAVKKAIFDAIYKNKKAIRIGPSIAINERGFVSDLITDKGRENLDKLYINNRKNNSIVIDKNDDVLNIKLEEGQTIFISRSHIFKLMGII
jgi:hypothetical protein